MTASVLLVAVVVVWANRYQPLVWGGLAGVQVSDGTRVVSADDSDRPTNRTDRPTYRVVDPDVGTIITLSTSYLVESSSPFATTVESVGSPFQVRGDPQLVGFVDEVRVTVARGPSSIYQPFSPQRVEPGETVSLRVSFTIPACPWDTPGLRTVDTIPVTYRSLGFTHAERLPLGYSVAIQNGVACRTWLG